MDMTLLNEFGFTSTKSFITSLLATNYGMLFTVTTTVASFADYYFGVSNLLLILLLVLINLELITGLWAAKVRKRKIVSKKLQRFLLKIMIYFVFLVLLHRLTHEVDDLTQPIYTYMYSFTILYFVFVHVKSILENYTRITGKETDFYSYLQQMNERVFGVKPKKKEKD